MARRPRNGDDQGSAAVGNIEFYLSWLLGLAVLLAYYLIPAIDTPPVEDAPAPAVQEQESVPSQDDSVTDAAAPADDGEEGGGFLDRVRGMFGGGDDEPAQEQAAVGDAAGDEAAELAEASAPAVEPEPAPAVTPPAEEAPAPVVEPETPAAPEPVADVEPDEPITETEADAAGDDLATTLADAGADAAENLADAAEAVADGEAVEDAVEEVTLAAVVVEDTPDAGAELVAEEDVAADAADEAAVVEDVAEEAAPVVEDAAEVAEDAAEIAAAAAVAEGGDASGRVDPPFAGLRTNQAVIDLIKEEEGLRLEAYQGPSGAWLIGYGHGGDDVAAGRTITEAEAEALLVDDLAMIEGVIKENVTVPLNAEELSAMVDLAYNIGAGSFRSSSVLRLLNEGDRTGAADAFLMWNKVTVNGERTESPHLTERREIERAMFLGEAM